ncbi:ArnT family glycosyltransferase [Legionella spiritensis]|uniref:Dolichyl-phosphate-mannose-protein mannosyltransferase n=1 Tax=Legionella spiritensis TaxID=452 RepID=A0A0W0Z9K2_LEGSP|nr:glycosyltransferase family 39 protein [Legionella spiritensis]KTD65805.1 dolichyl-phosphate-mannose-protein mannosyltransferase [Legionella spiritensis]SNV41225.1 dolichyl-phosphate-mannose-protein mannosyltransferase [Legionella spiritensis]
MSVLQRVNHLLLLLALFSLLLMLPGMAGLPVIDRDEAHFAQASRQMAQSGNYFQVRFQDKTRFQKPPGINWLQAASVQLFGNADLSSIWPYRIPSLLGAFLSVLLTYWFGRYFINEQTALIAAAILASSLLLIVETHMAVIDTSLLSSILLMQGALWIIYQAGQSKKTVSLIWPACFWLAMSYGMVLKGVTPLVGVLSIISLCLIERRVDWLRQLRILPGLALFTALSLAWLLSLNAAENSNYLMQMLHKDLLPKLQGGHESHGKPPLFHLAILPLTFWPASLFLWPAGEYAVKNRRTPIVKFLLSWLLPTWLFFELMPTKLPQYVLPTFPAIAILMALAIEDSRANGAIPGKWLRFLQGGWLLLSMGLLLALLLLPYLLTGHVTLTGIMLLVMVGIVSVVAVMYARGGAYYRAVMMVFLCATLSYPLIFARLLPELKPVWITDTIAKRIDRSRLSDSRPLLVAGFEEPSLVFNLDTRLVRFTNIPEVQSALIQDKTRLALIEETVYQAWDPKQRERLTVYDRATGYNYSKGRWVRLLLIGQSQRNGGVDKT